MPQSPMGGQSHKTVDTSAFAVYRLLYWVDFREDTQAGIYAYSLNDATKSRLVPNVQIRPRTIGFDFAGILIIRNSLHG